MHNHPVTISSAIALILLSLLCATAFGQQKASQQSSDSDTDMRFEMSFDIGAEYRSGYTEYEIQVGRLTVLPEDVRANAGSRLRFPINSRLTRVGASLSYGPFSAIASARFHLKNSDEMFKDYDWFEIDGRQKSFIYGTATGNDKSFQMDLDLGYSISASRLRFTPTVRLSWVRMSFEAENVLQTGYYAILEPDTLWKLDEPVSVSVSALAITYEIDYLAAYIGGKLEHKAPFGLKSELMLLVSPAVLADDLDTHLLRQPPKTAEISSDGHSAIFGVKFGYGLNRTTSLSVAANYNSFKTSGSQKQTELGEPFRFYTGIPAEIKAEWYSISAGLTLDLGI